MSAGPSAFVCPSSSRRIVVGLRHEQILDKLAIDQILATVEDEVARLAGMSFIYAKHAGHRGARYEDVVPRLIRRWSGLLDADDSDSERMLGHQVAVALATCLHQVGLIDPELTGRAVSGIAELNARVWLSDVVERQSADIAVLLRSAPVALTRRPPTRETITFTRPGDVLAIRTGDVYCRRACARRHGGESGSRHGTLRDDLRAASGTG
ncbi:hypothetical protein [Aestuariimicrobium sp. Y1814]|uniref:hypothetical protein n=1 Tax=Aestuariimicrobium sp. Y1814 TaxID=3418742 RepID=UPI003DA71DB7